MILALLALAVALSPFGSADPLDGPPQQSGALALAPLLGGAPAAREPEQPTQPQPSSMAAFDQHLASEDLTDLQRLERLSVLIANGGLPSRAELDWARARLKEALSRGSVSQAKKRLTEEVRAQGLVDAFSGEQLLPANAPDSRIEPFVEMELRGAREAARRLLEEIGSVR